MDIVVCIIFPLVTIILAGVIIERFKPELFNAYAFRFECWIKSIVLKFIKKSTSSKSVQDKEINIEKVCSVLNAPNNSGKPLSIFTKCLDEQGFKLSGARFLDEAHTKISWSYEGRGYKARGEIHKGASGIWKKI